MPSPLLPRRAFLAALPTALWLTAGARIARASAHKSRVVEINSDKRGVTVVLELATAPFPAPGSPYTDSTVIAFVPHHHRSARSGETSVLVHFHGHNSGAERAMVAHQLREQLVDSKQNAILVVPQGPEAAADSSIGKLEHADGLARMLHDVLAKLGTKEVKKALRRAAPAQPARIGRTCVSAHSGGYHAAACAIRHGGVPIREVYLFDALYAEVDVFRDWVIAGRGKPMGARHKLVSFFTEGGTTAANTARLFAELEKAGVRCAEEKVEGTLSREEIVLAEAVGIRTRLAHGAVTSELNGLRDCLYASAFPRRLKTSWFDARHGARPLDHRAR